jgi:hypothetical protein
MRALMAALLLLAAGPAGAGEVVSQRPDQAAVVLYQQLGVAAVTETRTLDLPAGRSRIDFRGVADGMAPQTVVLQGLPGPQLERNYDFDLLSPGALLDHAIGQPATLVRSDPKTGVQTQSRVVLRSGAQGVVMQTADGAAEALDCSGLPEKLVFDGAPPGLTGEPTLSATIEAPAAGRYRITLAYLATGLRWSADYVARVRPGGRELDLLGWLTLTNSGATSFGQAPLQVVAGRLAQVYGADRAPGATEVERVKPPQCWPFVAKPVRYEDRAAAPPPPLSIAPPPPPPPPAPIAEVVVTAAKVSDLGDYKLYSLPEPTTLAAHQTKQVAFLSKARAPFRRIYSLYAADPADGGDRITEAQAMLRLSNTVAGGLGAPLPAGALILFEPLSGGGLRLTARDRVRDTAVGLPLEIGLGTAPDVTLTARRLSREDITVAGRPRHRTALAFTVRNAGRSSADVELKRVLAGVRLTQESLPHQTKDADALWPLTLPPGGEATVTFTAEETE